MKRTEEELREEYADLIEELKKRPMTRYEMMMFLEMSDTKTKNQLKLTNIIQVIQSKFPLYDVTSNTYKILTKEDIEQYRKTLSKKIEIENYDWR